MRTWYNLPDEEDGETIRVEDMTEEMWYMLGPDDGTGYWATDTEYNWTTPIRVNGKRAERPAWATNVVWFNK